jgi:hypothetical protein
LIFIKKILENNYREGDGIGQVIHYKEQHIVGSGLLGKDFFILSVLDIKSGSETKKPHYFLKNKALTRERLKVWAFF